MRLIAMLVFLSCLPFPTAVAFNSYRFGYGLKDAFWRTLMTPFEGSVWAPGFSEAAFSKVKIGMHSSEVFQLLGAPIRNPNGLTGSIWMYTWQETGSADFDQRWLDFDPSGHVKEIRKSFFID